MGDWRTVNHSKYMLQYHLMLVCKYRKRLLAGNNISSDIKKLSVEICSRHDTIIKYIETDKDHIHYMIETEPTVRLSDLVRTLKSYTTYHIWKKYHKCLGKCFWKEKTFWTDGYFICSVGNISEETLRKYIENQG